MKGRESIISYFSIICVKIEPLGGRNADSTHIFFLKKLNILQRSVLFKGNKNVGMEFEQLKLMCEPDRTGQGLSMNHCQR